MSILNNVNLLGQTDSLIRLISDSKKIKFKQISYVNIYKKYDDFLKKQEVAPKEQETESVSQTTIPNSEKPEIASETTISNFEEPNKNNTTSTNFIQVSPIKENLDSKIYILKVEEKITIKTIGKKALKVKKSMLDNMYLNNDKSCYPNNEKMVVEAPLTSETKDSIIAEDIAPKISQNMARSAKIEKFVSPAVSSSNKAEIPVETIDEIQDTEKNDLNTQSFDDQVSTNLFETSIPSETTNSAEVVNDTVPAVNPVVVETAIARPVTGEQIEQREMPKVVPERTEIIEPPKGEFSSSNDNYKFDYPMTTKESNVELEQGIISSNSDIPDLKDCIEKANKLKEDILRAEQEENNAKKALEEAKAKAEQEKKATEEIHNRLIETLKRLEEHNKELEAKKLEHEKIVKQYTSESEEYENKQKEYISMKEKYNRTIDELLEAINK